MTSPEEVPTAHGSLEPNPGVLMIWCNRPDSGRITGGRTAELNLLASRYHYVCPSNHTQLERRGLSNAKDPRIILKRCPSCRTIWCGPTLSRLRSRPGGVSGLLDPLESDSLAPRLPTTCPLSARVSLAAFDGTPSCIPIGVSHAVGKYESE